MLNVAAADNNESKNDLKYKEDILMHIANYLGYYISRIDASYGLEMASLKMT